MLATSDPDRSSLVGEVSLIEPLGADTFVEVAVGKTGVTCRTEPDQTLRLGDRVRLGLPAPSLHLFDAASGDRIRA